MFLHLQILRYIFVSRSGLSENELLDLIPGLTWIFLGPFCHMLHEHLVLKYQGGLLMFAHEQVQYKSLTMFSIVIYIFIHLYRLFNHHQFYS